MFSKSLNNSLTHSIFDKMLAYKFLPMPFEGVIEGSEKPLRRFRPFHTCDLPKGRFPDIYMTVWYFGFTMHPEVWFIILFPFVHALSLLCCIFVWEHLFISLALFIPLLISIHYFLKHSIQPFQHVITSSEQPTHLL